MTENTSAFWPSPQQNLIWSQNGAAWNAVALVLFEGVTSEQHLRISLEKLITRYEVLRTVFRASPGMKIPFQVILPSAPPAWEVVSGDPTAFQQELTRPFDLENGPLVHASFFPAAFPAAENQTRSALLLTLPALLSDGDSLLVLVKELESLYHGRELEAPGLPYTQFAQWQTDLLESTDENAQAAKAFWSKQPAAPLVFPDVSPGVFPGVRPAEGTFQPASFAVDLNVDASADQFLAAWQSLLWRLTGQAQFDTSVWFNGREYDELKNAPGLIGKFLPIPARFDGEFRFSEIVSQARAAQDRAAEWQEYFTRTGESSAAFEYRAPQQPGAFSLAHHEVCTERFTIKLIVQGPRLTFQYDAARFSPETVARWAAHYQVLLLETLAHPETPVARLPLLSSDEKRLILEDWNRTAAEYPRDLCLHQLFELQVERTPHSPAVRCGESVFSYSQLNEEANRLAHSLRRLGVGPDSLVGLCLERGVPMMVAVLGILKAGGAYVPVNADNPKARLAHQLTGVAAIVTEEKLAAFLPEINAPQVTINADRQSEPASNPEPVAKPDNLIYVIFTSGSTGLPKGVGVRHRNLVNYAWCLMQRLPGEQLNFATVSTLAADLGNTCIFPSLISGGCLHIVPQDVAADSRLFAQYQQQHPLDVLKIVPSHLAALLETEDGRGLLPRKHLITGGEPLTWRLVERVRQLGATCEIWNHYGPTETTVGSLMLRLKDFSGPVIPIGRPLSNTQVYIFDSLRQPVPIGVTGELYIGGDGVTAGYLNQPELTAERFTGGLYRTGDLARFSADGNVEFLGRGDDQVKIRGYRIELGEIEATLSRFSGVKQAVVIARPDETGGHRLLAYAVAPSQQDPEPLRAYLKEQLPPYMVPGAVLLLPKIPLTPNGKIDRANLPEPEQVQARVYTAPRTETERAVANIWAEVFRRDRIGVEDNFFDIGGHSLLATQVISRVREHFHVQLDMAVLFNQPTIAGVSQAIDAASLESDDLAIVPVSREVYRPRGR